MDNRTYKLIEIVGVSEEELRCSDKKCHRPCEPDAQGPWVV